MRHLQAYPDGAAPMVADWLAMAGPIWGGDGLDPTTTTLLIAVLRGLLLDRLATGDEPRTDAALARFAELIAR